MTRRSRTAAALLCLLLLAGGAQAASQQGAWMEHAFHLHQAQGDEGSALNAPSPALWVAPALFLALADGPEALPAGAAAGRRTAEGTIGSLAPPRAARAAAGVPLRHLLCVYRL